MAVDKARIGFVGLGIMGTAMTLRLLDQGWPVTVWNLEPERVPPLVVAGAKPARSPREVAQSSDIVRPGKIVVDHSTIEPAATREMAQSLQSKIGMRWVENHSPTVKTAYSMS